MISLDHLTDPHVILLAVHLTSTSNLLALHSLLDARLSAFPSPSFVLRILLTHLPGSVDPTLYTPLVSHLTTPASIPPAPNGNLTLSPDVEHITSLSTSAAHKKANRLDLLPLVHQASCPGRLSADLSPLDLFVVHRAHVIDSTTGLLSLVARLAGPFLPRSAFLRAWYASDVQPWLRLAYEAYPTRAGGLVTLDGVCGLEGRSAVASLMEYAAGGEGIVTDLREGVGIWVRGEAYRRQRVLARRRGSWVMGDGTEESGEAMWEGQGKDWEVGMQWLVECSHERYNEAAEAIALWEGPGEESWLKRRYAQMATAVAYSAKRSDAEAVGNGYRVLGRVSERLGMEGPPPLELGSLPAVDRGVLGMEGIQRTSFDEEKVIDEENPLTSPSKETHSLLQMGIFSAHVLIQLGHPMSVSEIIKLRSLFDSDEQHTVLEKILHGLLSGKRKKERQWLEVRDQLLWLWGWGMGEEAGLFCKVKRKDLETEIMRTWISAACYTAVQMVYLDRESDIPLSMDDIENIIISSALNSYDNASNGNRTRGSAKKASDTIAAFKSSFPNSLPFRRTESLLSATHSISFYSLTLTHGVPFLPVNIRVSSDPLSLVEKILAQNPRSYTKLDDLISIGNNLVIAMGILDYDPQDQGNISSEKVGSRNPFPNDSIHPHGEAVQTTLATRRVIAMAIEAALHEDDFETAYSYVVNRLDPTSPSPSDTPTSAAVAAEDDISWRAALSAGRYRPRKSLSGTTPLRTLHQRLDLLSRTLLLAPPTSLPSVLTAWRKCDEELDAMIAADAAAERAWDDAGDRRMRPGGVAVPGGFESTGGEMEDGWGAGGDVRMGVPRRTAAAAGERGRQERPLGLLELARQAFPLKGAAAGGKATSGGDATTTTTTTTTGGARGLGGGRGLPQQSGEMGGERAEAEGGTSGERLRKRDMVASAVTGGLASGIGWVLGATPVNQQEQGGVPR